MICFNCGRQLPDVSRFCPYCGTNLSLAPAPQTAAEEPAVQAPVVTAPAVPVAEPPVAEMPAPPAEEPAEPPVEYAAPAAEAPVYEPPVYEAPAFQAPQAQPVYAAPAYMPPQFAAEPDETQPAAEEKPKKPKKEKAPKAPKEPRAKKEKAPKEKKPGKAGMIIAIILAVVLIASAGLNVYQYLQAQDAAAQIRGYQDEIAASRPALDEYAKLEGYLADGVQEAYAYEDFGVLAIGPVLTINKGETGVLYVSFTHQGNVTHSYAGSGISIEWGEFANNGCQVNITGLETGVTVVTFKNDVNDEEIRVLVLVGENGQ